MASFSSSGWASGATVNVYAQDAFGNATGASVTSAAASSAGVVAFTGLADATKYVASDGSRSVRFQTPAAAAAPAGGAALTGARVRATAIQSLANTGDNWLAFAAEDYDTGGYHDNVTNNTRLTAPVHGIYDIGATCEVAANTGGKRELAIIVNRLTAVARDGRAALVSGTTRLTIGNCPYELQAGDYVEVSAVQSASGALDTVVASGTISGVAAWISLRVAL